MSKSMDGIGLIRRQRLRAMYEAIRDKEVNQGNQVLSQAGFAARIVPEIAASDMSKFLSGDKRLSDKMCRRIVESFPEYEYRVAWLMGDDDIPTEQAVQDVKNFHSYIDRMTDESHVVCTKRNLLQIIRTKALHDKDITIKATSEHEDFSDFQVSIGNEEPFTIPATDFAQLAFDIEHYAIFRLKEYKNRGYI